MNQSNKPPLPTFSQNDSKMMKFQITPSNKTYPINGGNLKFQQHIGPYVVTPSNEQVLINGGKLVFKK